MIFAQSDDFCNAPVPWKGEEPSLEFGSPETVSGAQGNILDTYELAIRNVSIGPK